MTLSHDDSIINTVLVIIIIIIIIIISLSIVRCFSIPSGYGFSSYRTHRLTDCRTRVRVRVSCPLCIVKCDPGYVTDLAEWEDAHIASSRLQSLRVST